MKQALNILIAYLTCTDPVMVTKWQNILASFWHKDEGQVVTEIVQDSDSTEITIKDGDGTETTTSIPIYVEPAAFAITKITGLQTALDNKVDKVVGKGLSTEDFTSILKTKLDGLVNYVHPASHSIAEVDGLQDIIDGIAQDIVDLTTTINSLNQYQYLIWNGYRLYKNAGNTEVYPEAGEELKGRGNGTLFSGEIIHATAKIDNPTLTDADFNLKNSYP
tara:strand:+ start:7988 stop:8647 length:660 start_codon:yes stop_codon:yes gene_type:complete